MADIVTVKRMLADRAQSVAEMLLPQGHKEGQEWRAGSTGGEKGQSLGVHLSGQKAGVWQDFSTGKAGTCWISGLRPRAARCRKRWTPPATGSAYQGRNPIASR
jgi:hypothetical protein